MLKLAWAFAMGLPVGALAGWCFAGTPPRPLWLEVGCLLGGVAVLAAVFLAGRYRDDDPSRGAHLTAAASTGLVAVPALAAAVLRIPPAPGWLLAGTLVLVAFSLYRGALVHGPSGGVPGQAARALLALAGGTAGVALLATGVGLLGGRVDAVPDFAASILDHDAGVPTLPIPRCAPEPARVEVLLERGARPRFGPDGRHLWFDAVPDSGNGSGAGRQIHRLEWATGEITCWTCREQGENLRPAISDSGGTLVFETDRHATWWDPTNTEIHLVTARGDRPRRSSRRLTYSPGPDDHAILGPGGRLVVWSRRVGGRYAVVSAVVQTGHGGMMLGAERVLYRGGAQWTAPVAWSPDARSLVVVRGNPFRPRSARAIDLATGRVSDLGRGVAAGTAASFNGDGGFVAVAGARRARIAGLLPSQLGVLLGPFAASIERDGPVFRETEIRTGEPWDEGAGLDLGETAAWGEPTGVSLSPDGTLLVLGQRRGGSNGHAQERLVRIDLDCEAPGA